MFPCVFAVGTDLHWGRRGEVGGSKRDARKGVTKGGGEGGVTKATGD